MVLDTYLTKWDQIPAAVKQFLLKGVILLIAWKVVYLFFLSPTGFLDKPLTITVCTQTVKSLNWVTNSGNYSSKSEVIDRVVDAKSTRIYQEAIYFRQRKVVTIEDACNGLELFVLYAGFIICLPALLSRKLIFIIAGILIIHLVNLFRCAGITYITLYYLPHADFAHHYVFFIIVYACIIALWLGFSNKLSLKNNVKQ
ncbi:MAG: hypothetical protein JWR67_3299 [Mucilaginibacter sp.]|nr:hypothetical protein [Mucilaginibacter sp.]